jgi:hypothetical protein
MGLSRFEKKGEIRYIYAIICEKEVRRNGKEKNHLSIPFCCSYSRFFLMPLSQYYRYQACYDERTSDFFVGVNQPDQP